MASGLDIIGKACKLFQAVTWRRVNGLPGYARKNIAGFRAFIDSEDRENRSVRAKLDLALFMP
jgi:hypothetical protein